MHAVWVGPDENRVGWSVYEKNEKTIKNPKIKIWKALLATLHALLKLVIFPSTVAQDARFQYEIMKWKITHMESSFILHYATNLVKTDEKVLIINLSECLNIEFRMICFSVFLAYNLFIYHSANLHHGKSCCFGCYTFSFTLQTIITWITLTLTKTSECDDY